MLNNYHAGNTANTLKINACSGGIYKTYNESWFKRFHLNSTLASELFRKENCFYNKRTNEYSTDKYELKNQYYSKSEEDIQEVVILQMIICGDMEVIAEIICKNDFDKYNEPFLEEGVTNE